MRHTSLHPLGEPRPAFEVRRKDTTRQPEFGIVRDPEGIVLSVASKLKYGAFDYGCPPARKFAPLDDLEVLR
jgi:hypothetical protein